MIRLARSCEIDSIIRLWLETTQLAHPFIAADYWQNNCNFVKNELLPQAKTFVYIDKHQLKGFISILDDNYIGALFVDKACQGMGIGGKLLEYVRRHHSLLRLNVYAENMGALRFYQHLDFKLVGDEFDAKTKAKELTFVWCRGNKSGKFQYGFGDS